MKRREKPVKYLILRYDRTLRIGVLCIISFKGRMKYCEKKIYRNMSKYTMYKRGLAELNETKKYVTYYREKTKQWSLLFSKIKFDCLITNNRISKINLIKAANLADKEMENFIYYYRHKIINSKSENYEKTKVARILGY